MRSFINVRNGIYVLCYTFKITKTELGEELGVTYGTINNRKSGNSGDKKAIFLKNTTLKPHLTK